jgi:2-(1,2-epoxy-1,2-dihydrophenyl)acetyl-CoA isomerase
MSELLVERDGGVVRLTLNRPEALNAITGPMWGRLGEIFREVATNPDDRVLVVAGAGKGFCAGVDLAHMGVPRDTGGRLEYMRVMGRAAQALHDIPKPTVAAVNGVAAGAGANLAFGCDLVIAADTARFSEIFVQRGVSIDFGGSWILPRRIGLHRAKELTFLAEVIDAAEAERIGLVNRVVAAAQLDDAVAAVTDRLLQMAPVALAQTKRLLDQSATRSLAEALDAEAAAQVVNLATDDAVEAVRAFREKRPPNFTGR